MTEPRAAARLVFAVALIVGLWPSSVTAAPAATPFYLGAWTIVSADPAPWTADYSTREAVIERSPAVKLVGTRVVFGPRSVEGPPWLACPHAHYAMNGFAATQLFDGRLDQVSLPAGAPATDADPSGDHYSAQKLAENLGFQGFSWKALSIGCESSKYVYFIDPRTAVFQIDEIVLTMKRN